MRRAAIDRVLRRRVRDERIAVGPPREEQGRVVAKVAGRQVWFESPDERLAPSAEAFGSALFVSALELGRQLELDASVDPTWLENVGRLGATMASWWGFPASAPRAPTAGPARKGARDGTGLCFTLGVDSFHTLLRGSARPDRLVSAHGYDVPLHNVARAHELDERIRAVAGAVGCEVALVRSNLREHPALMSSDWEKTHGGALAALGHLLAGSIGTLAISATFDYVDSRPWGSHWRTDPLWSSSSLRVVHSGAELTRDKKLRAIAAEPLVQENLRVCWQEDVPRLNCSRCDKCVMTMVVLHDCGRLDQFPLFDTVDSLPAHLDALPATRYLRTYGALRAEIGDADVRGAISRLLERSSG